MLSSRSRYFRKTRPTQGNGLLPCGRLKLHAVFCLGLTTLGAASAVRSDESVLVQLDSAMNYLLPASDALGLTWTQEQFDDAGWAAGAYGVGYDAGAMIRTSVNSTADAVYTRADFSIVDLSAVETVWLAADYDDGYVAWINGVEVARRNMPTGDPTNTSTASSGHESSNGATPSYDAYIDVTAKAKPALHNGTNVLAVGVWNNDSGSTDLALVPRLSINRPVPPPGEVVWSLAGSPYTFNTSQTIPRGTILRVEAGVEVRFAAGSSLTIEGQIEALGTEASPILFERSGGTGSWGGIRVHHASDGTARDSTIQYAVLKHAGTTIDIDGTGDSVIVIEHCIIDNWSSLAFHWDNGSNGLRISHCDLGLETPSAEQGHEAVNGYRSSAILEHCRFGRRTGYNDTIDLGNAHWGGVVPTVRFNEIGPGEDDGIDFDDCDGYVVGNLIWGHRPPANGPKESGCPEYPIGGGGVNGGGITGNEGSRPVIMNNIVANCYQAIGYKNGAKPTLINNTIVGCTWGVVLFQEADISNPELAEGTLVNNLIWDCQIPIKLNWCDDDSPSLAHVRYCLLPGGWPGVGNVALTESPFAITPNLDSPVREDFALARCSPAIDAGFAGDVVQPFHTEPTPETDSLGSPRTDLSTVADTGGGAPTYYDVGAVEFTGPDDCGGVPVPRFVRGEANGDGQVDISDAVTILLVLFTGVSTNCLDALDTDDDGGTNVTDALHLLEFLFREGTQPPAPFPSLGPDPTADSLDCQRI